MLKIFIIFSTLWAGLWAEPLKLSQLDGTWHMRVLDGMEVRKARAILDFNAKKMHLSGFDACNRIEATLIQNLHTINTNTIKSTKMACRKPIHTWVSKRLQETLKEGFSIQEVEKYGVEGLEIKSVKHTLFFKRMGN